MSIWRLFIKLFTLSVVLSFCPRLLLAQTAAEEKTSRDESFQAQTNLFLFQQSLEFQAEIVLHESFLIWLYEGITDEGKKRRREDLSGTLDALAPLNPATLDDSSYVLPTDLDEAPPRVRYQAWEKLQREKYIQKYIQARRIKDRLLRASTPEQRRRMFNTDLKSTLESYNNAKYHQAILRFNELIELYDFDELADIVFLRGESFFKVTMYDRAKNDYNYVVKHSDDIEIKRNALERLIAIAGNEGDIRTIRNSWIKYKEETGDKPDEAYWRTAELTARFLMTLQEWTEAQELFDQIHPKTPGYVIAKLLAADCALGMLDFFDAESRYLQIAEGKIKGKGLTKEIKWEAMLKLGYIDYLKGEYYDAYDKLSAGKYKGEMAEKANLIAAWSLFRVHDYGAVVSLCNEFLEEYPKSQYFYEVFCLLGYSQEVIGRGEEAKGEYEKVMTAVDERREYGDINYEKKNIARVIGELQRLEPSLFLEGHRELFDRYDKLRLKLRSIFERLKLTEGIMSSPVIREMLDEQKELYKLLDELTAIEEELFATQDARLLAKYDKTYAKLIDLATDLRSGFRYQMQQKSLVHREQEQLFQARFADSLQIRFRNEWQSSEETLKRVRALISEAEQADDKELLLELGEIELGLMNLQVSLMAVSKNLDAIEQADLNSNLDHWSWFAYQRHSTAGLAFDYLYMRENRLEELDQYISQINSIIAKCYPEEEVIAALPDTLVPDSGPGEDPYYAPSIPLWAPSEYISPVVDSTAVEPDTVAVEELPSELPEDQQDETQEEVPGGEVAPDIETPAEEVKPDADTTKDQGVEGTTSELNDEPSNLEDKDKSTDGTEKEKQTEDSPSNKTGEIQPSTDNENPAEKDE